MTDFARRLSGAKDSLAQRFSRSAAGQFFSATAPVTQDPTFTMRMGQRAAAKFAADVISTPNATGQLLQTGLEFTDQLPGGNEGQPFPVNAALGFGQQASDALQSLPSPSASDVMAGTRTALSGDTLDAFMRTPTGGDRSPFFNRPEQSPGMRAREQFGDEFSGNLLREQEASARQPIATGLGDIAGDAGFMAAVRPFVSGRLGPVSKAPKVIPPTQARQAGGAIESLANTFSSLGRQASSAVPKTIGAGVEGAYIAALGDGDPMKVGGYSAGVQMGANLAMLPLQALRAAGGPHPVVTAGVSLWAGHELLKWVAPGPQEAFESKDEVIREIGLSYGVGALGALAGGTRNANPRFFNAIGDSLSAASRGGIASTINVLIKARERSDDRFNNILVATRENIEAFGLPVIKGLGNAARRGEAALEREVDRLFRNTRFRELYEERFGRIPEE